MLRWHRHEWNQNGIMNGMSINMYMSIMNEIKITLHLKRINITKL